MERRLCNYRNKYEIELQNGRTYSYESWEKLRYTDAETTEKEETEWIEFLKHFNFYEEGYEGRKRLGKLYVRIRVSDECGYLGEKNIYKEKFKKAVFIRDFEEVNPKAYTMRELVSELPAEEYIEYLKDRDMFYIRDRA